MLATPVKKNRVVVRSVGPAFGDGWDYRQMRVSCGKKDCLKCRRGPSHGPYWYAERNKPSDSAFSKTQTKYVGKKLRPVADVDRERAERQALAKR